MSRDDRWLQEEIDRERESLLERLQAWLEVPMLVLAFVWLALFVIELVWGLSPLLTVTGYAIWIVFIVEFALGFLLAPRKGPFLLRNWLKGIALIAPALRLLRVFTLLRLARAMRVARGLRLLRLLSSINRGMRALGASMSRRGFGYVVILTAIVTLAGAAAMYEFESMAPGGSELDTYGAALWWTAMLLTSLGSGYWPETAEGRLLCLFLALYGFGVFGYVTAALATFFIGQDAERDDAELAGARSVHALREEISALRAELRADRT